MLNMALYKKDDIEIDALHTTPSGTATGLFKV